MAGPGVDLVQVIFDRQAVSPNEDVAIITMHCRGVVAGLPDQLNPMDDTNRDNFAGKLDTWWNAIKLPFGNGYKLSAYKFYALPADPLTPLGPPAKTYSRSVLGGTGSGPLPTQIAMSVTFITDHRKTWGRFYLPGLTVNQLNGYRWDTSSAVSILNATKALTNRAGTGACLTVWSRVGWTHHDPQTIQIDDIPDVIRSRRLSTTVTRSTVPATT